MDRTLKCKHHLVLGSGLLKYDQISKQAKSCSMYYAVILWSKKELVGGGGGG